MVIVDSFGNGSSFLAYYAAVNGREARKEWTRRSPWRHVPYLGSPGERQSGREGAP